MIGQFDIDDLHGQSHALDDQSVLLSHLALLPSSLNIDWLNIRRQSG